MKTIIAQLIQLPPTSSTVHAIALLCFVGSYLTTGSSELSGVVAGLFALICPQDAPAINKAMQEAQAMERDIATAPKA